MGRRGEEGDDGRGEERKEGEGGYRRRERAATGEERRGEREVRDKRRVSPISDCSSREGGRR